MIKLIDNFMPEEQFKKLQKCVMGQEFPWRYTEHSSYHPENTPEIKDPLAKETPGYCHIIYLNDVDSFHNPFEELFNDFYVALNKLGYEKKHIIKMRANIKNPMPNYTEQNYNLPHIDYHYPHDVIIFYMNTCDGDTRLFDQFFQGESRPPKEYSTQMRISPKENRLLLFDGLQYHTASNPLNFNHRIVINVNLKKQ